MAQKQPTQSIPTWPSTKVCACIYVQKLSIYFKAILAKIQFFTEETSVDVRWFATCLSWPNCTGEPFVDSWLRDHQNMNSHTFVSDSHDDVNFKCWLVTHSRREPPEKLIGFKMYLEVMTLHTLSNHYSFVLFFFFQCEKKVKTTVLTAALLLSGIPAEVISRSMDTYSKMGDVFTDLCVYFFTFIFCHELLVFFGSDAPWGLVDLKVAVTHIFCILYSCNICGYANWFRPLI